MATIQLLRNLSLSSTCRVAVAHKRLPKGFNRPSAMSLFIQEEAKNKMPGAAVTSVFVAAKEKWSAMSVSEKNKYREEADKIGEQRRQEFGKLPLSQQEEMIREYKEHKERLAKNAKNREKRRDKEAKGYPKVPPNAYSLFVKEQLTGQASGSATERMAECAKKWKTMQLGEKAKYESQAEQLKKEYEVAKAQVEKK
ncbi:hypothetical protein QR680_017068 [Steinernema hermaphroditum]|uniref:HMG box domain-containing protein n=1 Tax=Steinernema hermaphroditum TaxID=289476 RepID=A0AA39HD73_9BILA|nr:hypothetical protein QR680_017068 [Steinernema hermaphroditum]